MCMKNHEIPETVEQLKLFICCNTANTGKSIHKANQGTFKINNNSIRANEVSRAAQNNLIIFDNKILDKYLPNKNW